ncbi:hypothetical protein [Ornithinimicrobium kibberense]|uniref:hypothetical protein n=1 Tax=Ornithinimicrobium kibberense TaxID=282060 RepID=UPI0036110A87
MGGDAGPCRRPHPHRRRSRRQAARRRPRTGRSGRWWRWWRWPWTEGTPRTQGRLVHGPHGAAVGPPQGAGPLLSGPAHQAQARPPHPARPPRVSARRAPSPPTPR